MRRNKEGGRARGRGGGGAGRKEKKNGFVFVGGFICGDLFGVMGGDEGGRNSVEVGGWMVDA